MSRAPAGARHGPDSQGQSLCREDFTQIHPPGTRPASRKATGLSNLRANFIALTANAGATMHYNTRRYDSSALAQYFKPPGKYPGSRPSPPGVQEGDRALLGRHEIHRNAVGHGHGEKKPARRRGVAVYPVPDDPPLTATMPGNRGSVYLVAQDRRPEPGLGLAEATPPGHDVLHRRPGPEPEIELGSIGLRPASDPRGNPVALPPARDLEPRDGTGHGGFLNPEQRGHRLTGADPE